MRRVSLERLLKRLDAISDRNERASMAIKFSRVYGDPVMRGECCENMPPVIESTVCCNDCGSGKSDTDAVEMFGSAWESYADNEIAQWWMWNSDFSDSRDDIPDMLFDEEPEIVVKRDKDGHYNCPCCGIGAVTVVKDGHGFFPHCVDGHEGGCDYGQYGDEWRPRRFGTAVIALAVWDYAATRWGGDNHIELDLPPSVLDPKTEIPGSVLNQAPEATLRDIEQKPEPKQETPAMEKLVQSTKETAAAATTAIKRGAKAATADEARALVVAQFRRMLGDKFPDEFYSTAIGSGLIDFAVPFLVHAIAGAYPQAPGAPTATEAAQLAMECVARDKVQPFAAMGTELLSGIATNFKSIEGSTD